MTRRFIREIGVVFTVAVLFAVPGWAAMECPTPPVMMAGANMQVAAHNPAAPIVVAWDRAVDMIPFVDPITGEHQTAAYDFRPILGSVNIAGGRYGLGTLLTTEWGAGGGVRWDGAQTIITPEVPLEPGTEYMIWVYKYISIQGAPCPRIGNRLYLRTAGEPPQDGNPLRDIRLSSIWRGNSNGLQRLNGTIVSIHPRLNLVSIDTRELGPLQIVLDEGSLLMQGERLLTKEQLTPGAKFQLEFFGERLTWMLLDPTAQPSTR